jgi:hypothetical protein
MDKPKRNHLFEVGDPAGRALNPAHLHSLIHKEHQALWSGFSP